MAGLTFLGAGGLHERPTVVNLERYAQLNPFPKVYMKRLPEVIASRNGQNALEVVAFEGVSQIPNRDAAGYYFRVRLKPDDELTRLAVVFSGTVFAVKPSAFGLPQLDDREATFVQFSLAAIGDYLDEYGPPEFRPSGAPAFHVECFSPHFQSWVDRTPGTDRELEQYITSHLLWAWRFDHPDVGIAMPDALRMRQGIPRFEKIIRLYEGERWIVVDSHPARVTIKPVAAYLRALAPLSSSREPVDEHPEVTALEPAVEPPTYVYVDESRIADLRSIQGASFDLTKLIGLCEELNICYRSQCYHAVAALTRAVMDHVPPIFSCKTFAEVANNYSGSKSFKECMQRLHEAARKIADSHLHTQVRSSEVTPTRTQVNFSNEVDVLLGEVVRLLKGPGRP